MPAKESGLNWRGDAKACVFEMYSYCLLLSTIRFWVGATPLFHSNVLLLLLFWVGGL